MQGSTVNSISYVGEAMTRVYNNMFLALINSMLVSYLVSTNPILMQFLYTGMMKWVVILAPLAAVIAISFTVSSVSSRTAHFMLHGFAVLMGMSFASIFVVFTSLSVVQAFLGAAVLFLTMSLYGYTTKRDLTQIGQFFFVGLIAIIGVSLFNLFIGSSMLSIAVSAGAVIIFLGLTAYDTQKIREMIKNDSRKNVEVVGALTLYLDFINLFIHLLQLLGSKR
jgi:FtsH-binding integral membrane protein